MVQYKIYLWRLQLRGKRKKERLEERMVQQLITITTITTVIMVRVFWLSYYGLFFISNDKTDYYGVFKSCTHVLWYNETLPSNVELQNNQNMNFVP